LIATIDLATEKKLVTSKKCLVIDFYSLAYVTKKLWLFNRAIENLAIFFLNTTKKKLVATQKVSTINRM
jgi:hypothetical protein